ncbi:MbnP family protein [Olleya sp. R77988]|uniref:MbnP family protein n=1 Tax=Olleya sp. R77988 TaxID=3093875 RepID=UPI0037C5C389
MKKIASLLLFTLLLFTCNEDMDDNTPSTASIAFNFTHNWDDTQINSTNLEAETVTNANGEVINIDRIRYLVSRFELVSLSGNTYSFDGYKFTDLSDEATYNFNPEINTIPTGTYTLRFIWGFNEEDNIDGLYQDLNTATWSWPAMLGAGYHFLQFDGMYNVDTTNPSPFNYHNGTARVSDGVFEQNFAVIELDTPISITNDASIEVKMNIAEFFTNPNTWDLNVLDTPLMPNYNAQKMMQENVLSVFSIGEITQ